MESLRRCGTGRAPEEGGIIPIHDRIVKVEQVSVVGLDGVTDGPTRAELVSR
jgi:hypothetical protein